MADNTPIEWADATWPIVTGCSVVSPGCTNCYAMRLAGTRMRHHWSRKELTQDSKAGPVWNGQVRFNEPWLDQPLRWKKPRRIFVAAHGDLFHESVPDEWIDRVFAVMALAPQHTFMVLTKRAERMRAYFEERWQGTPAQHIVFSDRDAIDVPAGGETGRRHQVETALSDFLDEYQDGWLVDTDNDALWDENGSLKARHFAWPLLNVWLGVSVEDQARADERIPHLLATPAAVRFLSCEPLLGHIDLSLMATEALRPEHRVEPGCYNALTGEWWAAVGDPDFESRTAERELPRIDWVIAGAESGPGARVCHPDWARRLRDDCAAAGVAFFWKQWGNWLPDGQSHNPAPYAHAVTGHRFDDGTVTVRVGKARAGRLLDGREHDGMPG